MTQAARAFWARANRRAAALSPPVARALLEAFAILRDSLDVGTLAQLIADGNIDQLMVEAFSAARMDAAFQPAVNATRAVIGAGAQIAVADLPTAAARTIAGTFNILHPDVIVAVRSMETKSLGTLKAGIRDVVRAHIENGLRDGVGPREVARSLRPIIGLAPNQVEAVANFEAMLRGGPRAAVSKGALDAGLRDKRFDPTLRRARATGEKLTDAQIAKMTDAYRARMLAFNAETNARTAALDALRLGQRLTWEQAAARGDVDKSRLVKTWVATLDERTRPEHLDANGLTVGFDELFPVDGGVMIPGENTWNCRCVCRYSQSNQLTSS